MVDGTSYSDGNDDDEHFTNAASTGPHSVVVSASDCGSEGLGFKSHQSHVGFFSPGRLLPRCVFESVALIT